MKLRIVPFAAVLLMLIAGYRGQRSPEVTASLQQIQTLLAQAQPQVSCYAFKLLV